MTSEKKKILLKVEKCLKSYKSDNSIYYQQLVSSYNEYKNMDTTDEVINDLYIKHLTELCEYIKERKNANITITMLILFSIFIVGIASFTTYKYYSLNNDLKNNLIKHNGRTSLNVHFNDSTNFNANTLSDIEHYMDLIPLSFSVLATNKDNMEAKVHYDVYLVEQNDDIDPNIKITKDVFLYNINTKSRESGVKALKNATMENGRILIFSGETLTNKEEEFELRMWIDSDTKYDYINKKYKFKIIVDGYVI